MKYPKAIAFGATGAAMVLCATAAWGAKKPNACAPAAGLYKNALDASAAGRLREAREQLLVCAQSACAISAKCKAAYDKLGEAMPSLVPVVSDEAGTLRTDVEVRIDGELLTSRLDGRWLPVESGVHTLSFSMDGSLFDTEQIMVVDGERGRVVHVNRRAPGGAKASNPGAASTASAPAPTADAPVPPPTPEKAAAQDQSPDPAPAPLAGKPVMVEGKWSLPHSVWPYAIGGAGLAAIAAGGLLTYWGNNDNTALQHGCAPNCSASSQDHIKTMYIASDISFGVGLAGLGVATWLFASSHSAERTPSPSAATLAITPTPSGAFASVAGSF